MVEGTEVRAVSEAWPTEEELLAAHFVAARWPSPFPWDDLDIPFEDLIAEPPF